VRLAKVIGTAVSTVKDPGLASITLQVCVPCGPDGVERPGTEQFLATDAMGAAVGEIVLVADGSAARVPTRMARAPTDATLVGIIDSVQLGGVIAYSKA
jgi:microcompartment protein CcmK/EutM